MSVMILEKNLSFHAIRWWNFHFFTSEAFQIQFKFNVSDIIATLHDDGYWLIFRVMFKSPKKSC